MDTLNHNEDPQLRYDPQRRWGCLGLMIYYIIVLIAIFVMLTSCARTNYVPVETIRTEYVTADTTGMYEHLRSFFESMYRRESSSDSLIDRTKETVVLKENGDTARHDKERIVYVATHREKELEHKIEQQDSIIKALRLQLESVKSDSIPVPYPVERQLTRWEHIKMDLGGIALIAIAVVLSIAVIWLARHFRR